MKEYKIYCNHLEWDVKASTIESAVRQVVVAEKNRLRERSKEIGKRLTLKKLEINWEAK